MKTKKEAAPFSAACSGERSQRISADSEGKAKTEGQAL